MYMSTIIDQQWFLFYSINIIYTLNKNCYDKYHQIIKLYTSKHISLILYINPLMRH